MTDWTAQARASAEQWMAAQQEWWQTVLSAGADAAPAAAPELHRQAVETWRSAAHRVADAQADVMLEGLGAGRGSQAEQLVARWTETQRQLWDGWMAAIGAASPPGAAPPPQSAASATSADAGPDPQDAGRRMVQALQESAEQLIRAQQEWAERARRTGGPGTGAGGAA
jgi:hypothetical protein